MRPAKVTIEYEDGSVLEITADRVINETGRSAFAVLDGILGLVRELIGAPAATYGIYTRTDSIGTYAMEGVIRPGVKLSEALADLTAPSLCEAA